MHSHQSGYFRVSDVHELYYELWGNPDGIPFVFVHGGPGAGCDQKDYNFFDPEKHHVLFYDQRGAGRSKPYCDLTDNTTQHLVEDQKALMDAFGMNQAVIFGGSWGSTLGLCFAIQYPEMVTGLVLRGIFLAEGWDREYYTGGGTELFFPKAYHRLISHVPEGEDVLNYYAAKIQSSDEEERHKYAYEWVRYECTLLDKGFSEEELDAFIHDTPVESFALMECHYLGNNCFLPEHHILGNADKLKDIETIIIHGRHDVICPPLHAYKLDQALKNSQLHIVNAGHSSSAPEVFEKLVEANQHFTDKLS